MTKVKRALIAGPLLASFLTVSVKSQTPGSGSSSVGHKPKTQALAMRLDSMEGLEIQSIREEGLEPVKTSADIATYQGRRALRVIR